MAVQFDFPQNADPSKFSAADWNRAGRKARTTPAQGSVTPVELAPSTTALIDASAQAAADAARLAAIADSNTNAATLAASAQANAISTAATALANHAADANPHPVYLTQAEGDARYLLLSPTLTLVNAPDDAAAATAGVAVGKLYRNGSVVMIRVA